MNWAYYVLRLVTLSGAALLFIIAAGVAGEKEYTTAIVTFAGSLILFLLWKYLEHIEK